MSIINRIWLRPRGVGWGGRQSCCSLCVVHRLDSTCWPEQRSREALGRSRASHSSTAAEKEFKSPSDSKALVPATLLCCVLRRGHVGSSKKRSGICCSVPQCRLTLIKCLVCYLLCWAVLFFVFLLKRRWPCLPPLVNVMSLRSESTQASVSTFLKRAHSAF